jgi:hypothetical protein
MRWETGSRTERRACAIERGARQVAGGVALEAVRWHNRRVMSRASPRSLSRSHVLLLPLVLWAVALLEQIVGYKVRQHVPDLDARAAILMALDGAGFGIAAALLGPWIKEILVSVRSRSHRASRAIGPWIFYALAYGAVFEAYLTLEKQGPSGLLPAILR